MNWRKRVAAAVLFALAAGTAIAQQKPAQTPPQAVPIQTVPVQNIPAPQQGGTLQLRQDTITVQQPVTNPVNPQAAGPLNVQGGPQIKLGKQGASKSDCGGYAQPRCSPGPATFVGFERTGCPAGSFFDLGKWSCWSCPSGYERGLAAVDTDRACRKLDPMPRHDWGKATYRGPLCAPPNFHDPIHGGECWTCPAGYTRSWASVEAPNACVIAAHDEYQTASRGRQTIWPSDCWDGTHFWDGKDGGYCWSCPGGYARTGYAVDSSWACSRGVAEKIAPASLFGSAQCGPGEFHDLKIPGDQDFRTGGGCYTCPQSWDRTIFPVDGDRACEKDGTYLFARATQEASYTCGPNEIYDMVGVAIPAVDDIVNQRNKELTDAGEAPLPKKGAKGTCWKCPPGSNRTTAAVYSQTACQPEDIRWVPAQYEQPGLFGLPGGEEVAAGLVRDGALINTLADGMAPALKLSTADARQRVWQEIALAPEASAVLKTAVYSQLQQAVSSLDAKSKASPDMQKLIGSTQTAMQDFAIFLAQDAVDAYKAWSAGYTFHQQNDYARSRLEVMTDYGKVPPDFEDITAQSILGGMASGGAASAVFTAAMLQESVFKKVFPYALKQAFKSTLPKGAARFSSTAARMAAKKAAEMAAEKAATAAAEQAAKFSAGFAMDFLSAGPQIIITASIELLAISIEQIIDINEALPKLQKGLATAQNTKPDLVRLMGTVDGQAEMDRRWALVMAGKVKPFDRSPYRFSKADIDARVALAPGQGMPVVQTAAAALKTTPVTAAATAVSPTTPTPTPTPQAAPPVKNTLPPGAVFAVAHPEALDIGVGPNGIVWFTGKTEPANAPDKLIYYVTPQGPKALPVGAAVRIAVDATNNPWVVNSGGNLYRWDGRQWIFVRPNVRDIGLGGSNVIWALGTDGMAWRWDGGSVWSPAPHKHGHHGAAIAVDPGGNPWMISEKGEIWRLQNNGWQQVDGWATDVAIAVDGTAFVVGGGGQIFKMLPGSPRWDIVPGAIGIRVGAGPAGMVHYTK